MRRVGLEMFGCKALALVGGFLEGGERSCDLVWLEEKLGKHMVYRKCSGNRRLRGCGNRET